MTIFVGSIHYSIACYNGHYSYYKKRMTYRTFVLFSERCFNLSFVHVLCVDSFVCSFDLQAKWEFFEKTESGLQTLLQHFCVCRPSGRVVIEVPLLLMFEERL